MRAHLAALGACLLLCLPAALAACPFTAGEWPLQAAAGWPVAWWLQLRWAAALACS